MKITILSENYVPASLGLIGEVPFSNDFERIHESFKIKKNEMFEKEIQFLSKIILTSKIIWFFSI